jgi:hypothetical protein
MVAFKQALEWSSHINKEVSKEHGQRYQAQGDPSGSL